MCEPGQWLKNGSGCVECTACPVLVPCGLNDTICRPCLPGFHAVNQSCMLQMLVTEDHMVMLFMMSMMELLFCAGWWRWWILRDRYIAVKGFEV